MPSVTMVSLLLEAADKLVEERPRSSAFKRRAVSTAYYAVFHALAKVCAESLLPSTDRHEDEYARVYRALDHGSLKSAFAKEPLRDHSIFRKIGDLVVPLQSERHRADYLPPIKNVFSRREAKKLIDQARLAVSEIEGLNSRDSRILATCLLFRVRQQ
jgi:uncharacterized protein (UPF0332 family)